ncbi:unnamed protein product [Schistocephalus solidus]|uniref:Uncharacterized protein n=1 Tax=Schistocephalus solidus TaxID=70667 RepID=A0A183TJS7_SCHSO|nr:unnamed protein product [Schistocephalus solidus]
MFLRRLLPVVPPSVRAVDRSHFVLKSDRVTLIAQLTQHDPQGLAKLREMKDGVGSSLSNNCIFEVEFIVLRSRIRIGRSTPVSSVCGLKSLVRCHKWPQWAVSEAEFYESLRSWVGPAHMILVRASQ